MLRFKNYLSEEVRPTAGVKDGGVDIENLAVRGQINATLANVTAQPAVTPYIVLHRISKALAYFHIILPKRAYLEGDRGVEVVEVKQFGDRMGMTNDGQFVHSVPSKYFLFISYGLASSMGADYAAVGGVLSSVGGMFKVTAKLVDEVELQRLLSMAEISLAEDCDAEKQQLKAKYGAPKEPMKDIDDSTEGTEAAADTSQRKKDKKLSASELDEEERPNAWGQYPKEAKETRKRLRQEKKAKAFAKAQKKMNEAYEKQEAGVKGSEKGDRHVLHRRNPGHATEYHSVTTTHRGGKALNPPHVKVGKPSYIKKHWDKLEEEQIDELYGKGSLGKIKAHHDTEAEKASDKGRSFAKTATTDGTKLNKKMKFYGKLGSIARKGEHHEAQSGRASDMMKKMKKKNVKEETQIDELWEPITGSRRLAGSNRRKRKAVQMSLGRKHKGEEGWNDRTNLQHSALTMGRKLQKQGVVKEETLDEKLTKSMSAGDVIHDFVHSKDPKFKGKSVKQRQKMALGAYYGMHPEKSKLDEMMSRIKKTTAHRKMATGVNTQTRRAIGAKDKNEKTMLVTRKGDPKAAAGGGVIRISKEKFDPSIYNRASE